MLLELAHHRWRYVVFAPQSSICNAKNSDSPIAYKSSKTWTICMHTRQAPLNSTINWTFWLTWQYSHVLQSRRGNCRFQFQDMSFCENKMQELVLLSTKIYVPCMHGSNFLKLACYVVWFLLIIFFKYDAFQCWCMQVETTVL